MTSTKITMGKMLSALHIQEGCLVLLSFYCFPMPPPSVLNSVTLLLFSELGTNPRLLELGENSATELHHPRPMLFLHFCFVF
jgi:hypothetical protein